MVSFQVQVKENEYFEQKIPVFNGKLARYKCHEESIALAEKVNKWLKDKFGSRLPSYYRIDIAW